VSFLAPLWLLLGAAAAVPLIIHLLRRRIGTRVDFPAARYLARAEQEHSRKLRLRNLLLMLLRVAVVLLLAAAAARPVGRLGGAGHAPTAIAIVLDNSLSTSAIAGGRTVLEELRDRARSVAAAATAADRLWLVTADGRVSGGDVRAIREAIDRVTPLAGAGDLAAATARAAALARASGLAERRVAILTDGQATAWPRPVPLGDAPVLAYVPEAAAPPNRAVVHAEARPLRWTPRGAVAAAVAGDDSATYRVTLGARTLARGTATAAAGADEVLVRAAPAERGWLAGTVEIEPDELRADDVRHFAVWIGAAPGVALDSGVGPFARSAVAAMREGGLVADGADVAIAPADALARLPALIVAPADPVRLGAATRALERAGVPWRFGALRRGESVVRGERMEGVTASERYQLVPRGAAPADTLARAGGEPWIVAGARYVLVASPLDPRATSLPARAAFVPWLTEIVTQRLTGEVGGVVAAAPGDSLARPAWAEMMEMPDGARVPLAGGRLAAPARAGVYPLLRGARRAGALVVNPEPDESALARLEPAALASRLRGDAEVRVLHEADEWRSAVFAGAARRPLLVPLLVAVMLLLLAESLAAGGAAVQRSTRAA
jgi:hypothetical protein